jgi:hypothetical protein
MLHDISTALAHYTHQAVPHDDPEEPEFDIHPAICRHMQPYLEMLVAPSQHCDKEKPASCRAVHRALDILLRFQLSDDIAALPDLISLDLPRTSNALATINFPCEPTD